MAGEGPSQTTTTVNASTTVSGVSASIMLSMYGSGVWFHGDVDSKTNDLWEDGYHPFRQPFSLTLNQELQALDRPSNGELAGVGGLNVQPYAVTFRNKGGTSTFKAVTLALGIQTDA
jgi:hypothetical protein